MPKEQYNDQARYLWSLMKSAGWDEQKLNALLLKKFKVTHPNALDQIQMRTALNIMKSYAAKAEAKKAVRMRHDIMAIVSVNGHNVDWLHDCMEVWGYGRSLRALKYYELIQVMDAVRSCFAAVKGKNVENVKDVKAEGA